VTVPMGRAAGGPAPILEVDGLGKSFGGVTVLRTAGLTAATCVDVTLHGAWAAGDKPLLHPEFSYTINQLPEGPRTDELVAKVVPDRPPTGKRTLQDNGCGLRCLTRDDVELVREGIDHIEPDAVVTQDGRRFEVDLIVYATGFRANRFLLPMEIVGRDGTLLSELWGECPSAYLGITTPKFPNLFMMYGPGTNLAHGGSLIFHSECQMRYIAGCLKAVIAGGTARWSRARTSTTSTTSVCRGSAKAWSGRLRQSSTPGTRTPREGSTSGVPGGGSTTGGGRASPT